MNIFENNNIDKDKLEKELLGLLAPCDIKTLGLDTKNGTNFLMHFFKYCQNGYFHQLPYNSNPKIKIDKKYIDFLIRFSDLNCVNDNQTNALIFALNSNYNNNYKLSHDQLDYLIKNTDLKKLTLNNETIFTTILFLLDNKNNLSLTKEQMDYLFQNIELNILSIHKNIPLKLVLALYENDNLNYNNIVSEKSLKYLIKNTDYKLFIKSLVDWDDEKRNKLIETYNILNEKFKLEDKLDIQKNIPNNLNFKL